MNYDKEPKALFENDEQFANIFDNILKQFDTDNKALRDQELIELWTKIANSETKLGRHGYGEHHKSIEHEKAKLTEAENALKAANETRTSEYRALKLKQDEVLKSFNKENALPNGVGVVSEEELTQILHDYRRMLIERRKDVKQLISKAERG